MTKFNINKSTKRIKKNTKKTIELTPRERECYNQMMSINVLCYFCRSMKNLKECFKPTPLCCSKININENEYFCCDCAVKKLANSEEKYKRYFKNINPHCPSYVRKKKCQNCNKSKFDNNLAKPIICFVKDNEKIRKTCHHCLLIKKFQSKRKEIQELPKDKSNDKKTDFINENSSNLVKIENIGSITLYPQKKCLDSMTNSNEDFQYQNTQQQHFCESINNTTEDFQFENTHQQDFYKLKFNTSRTFNDEYYDESAQFTPLPSDS